MHRGGFTPLATAFALPRAYASATAMAWATETLMVAQMGMPSSARCSMTSTPEAVAGSFTAMLGAQEWTRLA